MSRITSKNLGASRVITFAVQPGTSWQRFIPGALVTYDKHGHIAPLGPQDSDKPVLGTVQAAHSDGTVDVAMGEPTIFPRFPSRNWRATAKHPVHITYVQEMSPIERTHVTKRKHKRVTLCGIVVVLYSSLKRQLYETGTDDAATCLECLSH